MILLSNPISYAFILFLTVVAGEEFFFGGTVDLSKTWPVEAPLVPDIRANCMGHELDFTEDAQTNHMLCMNSTSLVVSSHHWKNEFFKTLQDLEANLYLLIEKQGEEVSNYEIPPPPFASLIHFLELSESMNQNPLTIDIKGNNYYKLTLTALHQKQIQGNIQYTPVYGFPVRDLIISTFPKTSTQFQMAVNLKKNEKHVETSKITSSHSSMSRLYEPFRLHPEIFSYGDKYLTPEFRGFLSGNQKIGEIVEPVTDTGIYKLNILSMEFCQMLIEEVDNYEEFLVTHGIDPNEHRPNFLNKFGVLLDEMGFGPFLESLMEHALSVLTKNLFREWGGDKLDSHHGFIVEYQLGAKDIDLEYHMDQAEVTLNLCLGKYFEGGNVFFNGIREHWSTKQLNTEFYEFAHVPGSALLHIGQHWHGAKKIQTGERYNLILWMRSSTFHRSLAEEYWARKHLDNPKLLDDIMEII